MDVDSEPPNKESPIGNDAEAPQESREELEEETPSDIAMVPMADMLNARYEMENVGSPLSNQMIVLIPTRNLGQVVL